MKKDFKFGLATGILGSALAVLSAGFGYKKLVQEPKEQEQENYEEVSRAAIRKSVAAHQSRF
ncbi:DUF3042 family protein [Fructobacillus evanidus]|uniref:DUF3042 family protein n=1 Tax=Fructobacillus evanidus TaxID=3064281 RepID=A0ABN9YNS3_9LACO|nr:hypothetical protein R55250_KEHBDPNM_00004 [Fructobacillus sp. LMG 32999]CAK1221519.1 hypothetical protein R53718_MFFEMHAI_00004 [Fructobacillus sp. LMG 32999]CAK1224609.1 hypothetical protein R55234_GCHJJDIB_00004 [Fructobacillus sp. LMG 32999]CAK1229616.1 hypothetical protein R54837_OMAIDLJD_00290 [Fructobacillus sp. LMG 32999]CAK1229801.1 hypothetical protein R53534_HOPDCFKK_00291 [Fructobacillus sp. LMG 32999]